MTSFIPPVPDIGAPADAGMQFRGYQRLPTPIQRSRVPDIPSIEAAATAAEAMVAMGVSPEQAAAVVADAAASVGPPVPSTPRPSPDQAAAIFRAGSMPGAAESGTAGWGGSRLTMQAPTGYGGLSSGPGDVMMGGPAMQTQGVIAGDAAARADINKRFFGDVAAIEAAAAISDPAARDLEARKTQAAIEGLMPVDDGGGEPAYETTGPDSFSIAGQPGRTRAEQAELDKIAQAGMWDVAQAGAGAGAGRRGILSAEQHMGAMLGEALQAIDGADEATLAKHYGRRFKSRNQLKQAVILEFMRKVSEAKRKGDPLADREDVEDAAVP